MANNSFFDDDFDDKMRELAQQIFDDAPKPSKRMWAKGKNQSQNVKPPAREENSIKSDIHTPRPKTFFRTIIIKGRKFDVSADAPISDKLAEEIAAYYQEQGNFHRPETFQFDDQYEDGDLPFQYRSPKMTQHVMFKTNEVQLEQVGDKLEIKIAYNLSFINAIKGLPKSQRYFDPKKKLWIVNVSQLTAIEALLKAAGADFKRFRPKSFDLYEVLDVHYTATHEEIKKSFYRLSRTCHPDVCKDFNAREKFEFLKGAYDVLRNPTTRKKYDFARRLKGQF